jgi:hypothetical protein
LAELPIDYAGVLDATTKAYNAISAWAAQNYIPKWFIPYLAGSVASLLSVGLFIVAAIVQGVLGIGTFFAVTVLGVFTQVRSKNAQDFNEVIAASMSELLGVEISASDIPGGQGAQGLNARVQAIGAKLHNLLASEFVQGGPITNAQGKTNAEKFTGFAINFSTGSAFIACLTEAVSLSLLKNFR